VQGLSRVIRVAALILIGLAGTAPGAIAASATPALPTWVTDASVDSIVTSGNTAYLGGGFTYLGPDTGSSAVLSSSTAEPLAPYSRISGLVFASVPDGSGGWYVGGAFVAVGGVARTNLAHIEANGSVDPKFHPAPKGEVNALALSGSTLYVGGAFKQIGSTPRTFLGAVNATTGGVTAWNPKANNDVRTLLVSGSTLYVGGLFNLIGGQDRRGVAAINTTTAKATSFNANLNDVAEVFALALSGGTLYIGGEVGSVGGQPRWNLAAVDAGTGAVSSWDPNAGGAPLGGPVSALAVTGSAVWAGAPFLTTGTTTLAAFDRTTAASTPASPHASGPVDALALQASTLYVGGAMSIDGGPTEGAVAIDADSGVPTGWAARDGVDGEGYPAAVYTLNASAASVFAGGTFGSIGGIERTGLAAIDLTTGQPTAWAPQLGSADPLVEALALEGSTLYVGGGFDSVDGQPRTDLAALDLTTGDVLPWNPAPNNFVNGIAPDGATIYVSGAFSQIGGQARGDIAALAADTGEATAFDPDPQGGGVAAIAVSGDTVYAGGHFSEIGGQPRNHLAALDPATGQATAWNPNATVASGQPTGLVGVNTIAVSGSTVYAGGRFTQLGGATRRGIGAVSATTGKATSWNPNATNNAVAFNSPGTVSAITVTPTAIYVGGDFTNIAGAARHDLAALAPISTARALSWNPDPNFGISPSATIGSIAQDGSTVLVGGGFSAVGLEAQGNFAAFPAP
jgi:hypothetical protein